MSGATFYHRNKQGKVCGPIALCACSKCGCWYVRCLQCGRTKKEEKPGDHCIKHGCECHVYGRDRLGELMETPTTKEAR